MEIPSAGHAHILQRLSPNVGGKHHIWTYSQIWMCCLIHVRAREYSELELPKDRNGREVDVGSRVKLLGLSGRWLDELPADEKEDVLSMIGEVFEVEEIDRRPPGLSSTCH